MAKNVHEIRDPIHVFIRLDSQERRVVDSRPFQRLRQIHQLAMTYLVYPGTTHKRFEHSLGVMELASRVYDVVTTNITDEVRNRFSEVTSEDKRRYWRRVLRMAALCHDIGHLPFSHAAEKELLPTGWTHERITKELILSDEMKSIWQSQEPPLNPQHIAKLAVGPKEMAGEDFSDWETILAEIIVGDAFGVDRMDYLLRDSYHAGVAYGRFDHYRLIDTLKILPNPSQEGELTLGVTEGGLQSSEALLLARYFMYSQVYFHPIRRIYDIHLKDFLNEWLPNGQFSTEVEDHLAITDVEITAALRKTSQKPDERGHRHAARILKRQHFKVLYSRNPDDIEKNPDSVFAVYRAACEEFGEDNVRVDTYTQKGGAPDFPVLKRDGRIVSSLAESQTLKSLPVVATGYVFISRECQEEADAWLNENRENIIATEEGEEDEK